MSASTVSITANTSTRRRPIVVAEQKKIATNIELFPSDAASPAITPLSNGEAPKNIKDPSNHAIHGEAVTSKEAVMSKKPTSGTRTRRALKPEKPRWLTVLSILSKNFLLMVVLLGLFQLLRKMVLDQGKHALISEDGALHPGMLDFEGRIADVEKLVKTTSKLVQAQVEAIDKKIESKTIILKRELNEKINSKAEIFEQQMNNLNKRNDALEKSLGEIAGRGSNWVSRDEFSKLENELKQNGGGGEVSPEDVRRYAQEIIEKEIAKHAADGLAMVDYALASGGASVIKHSEPFIGSKLSNFLAMFGRSSVHPAAVKIITPSFGEPGQCFPLKGSEGYVVIKLRYSIVPEAVTLEHIAESVAYDRSSAPKDCLVSGWLAGEEPDTGLADADVGTGRMRRLVEFRYDLGKSNAQTFEVDRSSVGLVDTVRLDFGSNHGSGSHTCIYRLRIHGRVPDIELLRA